ncbi:MAG: AMP-binding protein, partial [Betaproteobacteria bacterium]|nr:AMP-binding protein [Betaproteobacteria bacterium]
MRAKPRLDKMKSVHIRQDQACSLLRATTLKIARDNLETAMTSRPNPYREHLDPNPANYAVLTPIDFLDWAAEAYPDRLALIHGDIRQSWAVVQKLCQQMAAGIQAQQLGVGDTVAVMLPNIPAMIYAHFAVPM